MEKSTTIILAAVGLGGLGYFLYKKGLFSNAISEPTLITPTPSPTTPIVVNPDNSAAIEAAKKAKELADAELALLDGINADAAIRLAAIAEAQRLKLAQLEAETREAMESENVRLGRIEYERIQAAKLELIEKARLREAMLEAERLEAERLLNKKTTYPIKEEIISELVDTSDEPDEIDTGRNRYAGRDEDMPYYYSQNNYSQIVNTSDEPTRIGRNADGYQDQLNMQLNKILYN
jgi:hypothetical protein